MLHEEDCLLTCATHANKQAGGVAKTSVDNKAKEITADKTEEERMSNEIGNDRVVN